MRRLVPGTGAAIARAPRVFPDPPGVPATTAGGASVSVSSSSDGAGAMASSISSATVFATSTTASAVVCTTSATDWEKPVKVSAIASPWSPDWSNRLRASGAGAGARNASSTSSYRRSAASTMSSAVVSITFSTAAFKLFKVPTCSKARRTVPGKGFKPTGEGSSSSGAGAGASASSAAAISSATRFLISTTASAVVLVTSATAWEMAAMLDAVASLDSSARRGVALADTTVTCDDAAIAATSASEAIRERTVVLGMACGGGGRWEALDAAYVR